MTVQTLVPVELIQSHIYLIREQKVILDSDLAELYQVETKNLNKAVSRNLDRFPEDFMFQLTADEHEFLRFQIGTSNEGRGGRRYLPYAFTEQGVAMLSSVLKSDRAVQVNIAIMRAFFRMREAFATHQDLVLEVEKMKLELEKHGWQIDQVFAVIEEMLTAPPDPPKRQIGFPEPIN